MSKSTEVADWEDLRKQARHLENEIDAKLVAYSKLGINTNSSHASADTVPLLDEDHVFDNMTSEIGSLLTKLAMVNDRMSEIPANGAAMLHTMQRHKEILKDYKLEFSKLQNNFMTRKDREELLGSVRKDIDSDRLLNDQINIAIETRDNLMSQRQTFKRIQTRFNDISNRFPAVNSLIQRINLRKRRDSLLLGLLVGFCTFLMLVYAFR